MDGPAGFGIAEWLPPKVQRAMVREDAHEALEAKRAEAARADRLESSHQRALTLAAEQAQLRGEEITALALARGEIRGRTVGDVFAAAALAAEAEDRRDAARAHRDGHGQPERLHVEVGEPVLHTAPRSERGLVMFNNYRRFREAQRAKAKAAAAATASADDWGIVEAGVTDRTGFR